MNVTVKNGARRGSVTAPASKSEAHRALICAALSKRECRIVCGGISKDIAATADCLGALGAGISVNGDVFAVRPISGESGNAILGCRESGSTLRFLLPVVGALGREAVFRTEGRLAERPIDGMISCLGAHGMKIEKKDGDFVCSGSLAPGEYSIPGDVSSQYISGLLFALPLLPGDSTLTVTGRIESRDYIAMTEKAIASAGIEFEKKDGVYRIRGGQSYRFPETHTVGRDWSGAAFFLCIGAASADGVTVKGLSEDSAQGDRAILDVLRSAGAAVESSPAGITVSGGRLGGFTVDASAIPDLVPALSAAAATARGVTVIRNAGRLRYKESDRLKTTRAMLSSLGADVEETADGLIIKGKEKLSGGTADSFNDHRIAMSAAVAASACGSPVTVTGAECVEKSYPGFWNDLNSLEVI